MVTDYNILQNFDDDDDDIYIIQQNWVFQKNVFCWHSCPFKLTKLTTRQNIN
jgi:hypothetical protein